MHKSTIRDSLRLPETTQMGPRQWIMVWIASSMAVPTSLGQWGYTPLGGGGYMPPSYTPPPYSYSPPSPYSVRAMRGRLIYIVALVFYTGNRVCMAVLAILAVLYINVWAHRAPNIPKVLPVFCPRGSTLLPLPRPTPPPRRRALAATHPRPYRGIRGTGGTISRPYRGILETEAPPHRLCPVCLEEEAEAARPTTAEAARPTTAEAARPTTAEAARPTTAEVARPTTAEAAR
jgi:hypothetical protein